MTIEDYREHMKQYPAWLYTGRERLSPARNGSEFEAAGAYRWVFGRSPARKVAIQTRA
jgi:hypothetical protein